ncbi:MAG: VOC family protein [Taibaiella sp.]|nr:VOC family protein [Taibaiella sp.]
MHDYISGIQQIGIGVKNANEGLRLYKELFGMDALIFNDVSEATLMSRYTGGTVFRRHALLSINLEGGGGVEIWQFKDRQPVEPANKVLYGDLGIYAAKIKCPDISEAHKYFKTLAISISEIQTDPKGELHFWIKDAYGNQFNIVKGSNWFQNTGKKTGGVCGAVIGVGNIESALKFYRDVLGINEVIYDVTGSFVDNPAAASALYRRVLLQKNSTGKGAFNKLLGSVQIELVECLDRKPEKIYDQRYWGDCGFIHLCFDVLDMDQLKAHTTKQGFVFSVDSNESFAMESASGRFCYVEDPDGTLIELVETHRVPILKKIGWYLNLKKRNIEKPLPDWMIKMLALSKVK